MYQPYPGQTEMPQAQRPPAPAAVRNAVKVMYAGAAVWIFLARACQSGKNWARITGTVLFAIATLDTVVGLTAPLAGLVKIWGVIVWLVALTAIVFLWRRESTAFFKATPA
jgi:hypothetical protein